MKFIFRIANRLGLSMLWTLPSYFLPTLGFSQSLEFQTVEVVAQTPLPSLNAKLQDTPTHVQLLNKDSAPLGGTNLVDVLNDNIGGISVSNATGNVYQNDVNYRGFQATSVLGAPVGLSVYFDGVRFNEPFGSIVNWDLIPMNAVSSVSLMPGSNPLFGLNTLGGAVAVNTKNGQDNLGSSLSVLGGAFGRKASKFDAGWIDSPHNTDYFVAANLDQQDGYRSFSSSRVFQGFGKARWQSDDLATKFELSLANANNVLNGTQALPMSMMGDPKQAYTAPDSVANQMTLINVKGSHWSSENDLFNGNLFFRQSNATSVNSNANLDDGCFDSNSDVIAKCQNLALNGTAPNSVAPNALGLKRFTGDINTDLIKARTTQESLGGSIQWTNLDNFKALSNAFTIGSAFDVSKIGFDQSTVLAQLIDHQALETGNLRYFFPSTTSASGTNVLDKVGLNANTSNFSIFSTDTLNLSEHWSTTVSGSFNLSNIIQTGSNQQTLNGDGGYSWTDPSSQVNFYNPTFIGSQYYSGTSLKTIAAPGSASSPTVSVASGQAGPQVNSLSGNHHYRRFNPAFGMNYNPTQSLGFFASYSESMRAPTPIELSCANPNSPCALPTGFNGDPDLRAVVAKTFELGARGKFNSKVSWSTAIYNTRTSNDIEFLYDTATTGYFNNVGSTERSGLELGIQSKSAPFKWSLNYGYVNAQYLTPFTTAQGVSVTSGSLIPGIAEQTLKIKASYRYSSDLTLGANWALVSGQFAHGDENNLDPRGKIPGYGVVNFDLHYYINDDLNLFGVLSNAFNHSYSTYAILGTNVYSGSAEQFRTPAAPRAFWLGANYSFGRH